MKRLILLLSILCFSQSAWAGVILCPVFPGLMSLFFGIFRDEQVLIVLDSDGNVSRDALEHSLAKTYPFIDDDQVISDLATAISVRANAVPRIGDKKLVKLTRDEIISVIEPSGLGELRPAEVSQLMTDMM